MSQWRDAWAASKGQGNTTEGKPQTAADPFGEMLAKLDASAPLQHVREGMSEALIEARERARSIEELRAALTDKVMAEFMPLMNTPLGFRTDRPSKRYPQPYTVQQVREVFVQALFWKLPLLNNVINIISEQCYITGEGFTYLLKHMDGLTDLMILPEVPIRSAGGAVVPFTASWVMKGVPNKITGRVPVRTDEYSTIDQIIGKAMAKIRGRVYETLTGCTEFTKAGEVDEVDEPEGTETRNPARLKGAPTPGPIQPLSAPQTPPEPATGAAKPDTSAPWS